MCTPLMAQRCLLHHTALATGFCLFPALKCTTGCLRAHRGGTRRADCTWHSEDNSQDVFDVLSVCMRTCISEGAHLVIAAEQSYSESIKRCWLQFVCGRASPGSSVPHVRYCENKYGHFISTAAWAPMCWNVQLLWPVPGQTHIPVIFVHNAVVHSCTKKSKPLSRYSNDLIPGVVCFTDYPTLEIQFRRNVVFMCIPSVKHANNAQIHTHTHIQANVSDGQYCIDMWKK